MTTKPMLILLFQCIVVAVVGPSIAVRSRVPNDINKAFLALLSDIRGLGGDNERINAWAMSSEHLFVGTDVDPDAAHGLRDRVIEFSRVPGGLDFLFDRLSSKDIKPSDVMICCEILLYFGEYDQPNDDKLHCVAVPNYDRLISLPQIMEATKRYADAPIKEVLQLSIRKASALTKSAATTRKAEVDKRNANAVVTD